MCTSGMRWWVLDTSSAAAAQVWATLEAKHIQWDTLSHHILPVLLACGQHSEARPPASLRSASRGAHARRHPQAPATC